MREMKVLTNQVFKALGLGIESEEFKASWDLGLDVVAVSTDDWTLEEMEGDCFNPEVNSDIDPAVLKREREHYAEELSLYGVWGFGLAVEGEPDYSTFVWGYEGKDMLKTLLACQAHELLHEMKLRKLATICQ